MNSKSKKHIGRIKEMPCSLCDQPGPSDCHHILEGRTKGRRSGDFCTIPLCKDCHQGRLGIHGDQTMLRIKKESELSLLGQTLEKLYG